MNLGPDCEVWKRPDTDLWSGPRCLVHYKFSKMDNWLSWTLEAEPAAAALERMAHGARRKPCFPFDGSFNDSRRLSLGHEMKQWDGPQQVSTGSAPCCDFSQLFNCEMSWSPQVNNDQNRSPGVRRCCELCLKKRESTPESFTGLIIGIGERFAWAVKKNQ